MRLWIIGGDHRHVHLAGMATEKGWEVWTTGFDGLMDVMNVSGTPMALQVPAKKPTVILLPVPYCRQGFVPAPLALDALPVETLYPALAGAEHIFCGMADDALKQTAKDGGAALHDLYEDDLFAVKNAIPSAEGAIHAAMTRSRVTVCQSPCLVLGYGRVGHALARQLQGLGGEVYVMARKEKDRALAWIDGYRAITVPEMPALLPKMRFVFNTVPSIILNAELLEKISPSACVVDVASSPYGIDFNAAARLGLQAWVEPAIPGRYSPETAGQILLETITQTLHLKE